MVPDYMKTLMKEIAAYQYLKGTFDSLYLGGGSPSVLGEQDLTRLFENLFIHFSFSPDTEITFEANPDDITREKLVMLKMLGVTRISLGVQSFDDHQLRFLGRRHTARQAEQAVEWIGECGINNLGLDLIYGLPGQQESNWIQNMKHALKFRPEHLSCYQLTLHDGTPLRNRFKEGQFILPTEEEERSLFLLTAKVLEDEGYLHYEISNFARGEGHIARHNSKYWHHNPYLGLGPAAHSFWGGVRWWNVSCVKTFCEMLGNDEMPVAGSETLTQDQQQLESLYLGLRTREGFDLSLLCSKSGANETLARLQEEKLVEICKGRVIPTREGYVVADSLPLLFVQG
jgi:oxygen-independent coproporphyrinogen-3 oxidase